MKNAAPYHADIAGNPDGICHWLVTADGVRIRVGHWPVANAVGTVLLFPGRTEYIEKYGRTATDFGKRGFACAAIDWRGQGIADRLLENRAVGHVEEFEDYQLDVKAMLDHVKALGLPEPYHLLGHSMGGCIGLRALYDELPVESAAFSAPMWGIRMSPALRPIAWGLSSMSKQLGFSGVFAPGQQAETYVLRATADDNTLTSDATSFDLLQRLHHFRTPFDGRGDCVYDTLGMGRISGSSNTRRAKILHQNRQGVGGNAGCLCACGHGFPDGCVRQVTRITDPHHWRLIAQRLPCQDCNFGADARRFTAADRDCAVQRMTAAARSSASNDDANPASR